MNHIKAIFKKQVKRYSEKSNYFASIYYISRCCLGAMNLVLKRTDMPPENDCRNAEYGAYDGFHLCCMED